MKNIIIFVILLFLPGLVIAPASQAEEYLDAPGQYLFSPEELDDLLAPIALYPDPLLAQVLPAATFVDQIDEAARFVRLYGKSSRIDSRPWDVSVKAVAHYPQVLYMMDQKYDWTVSVGQAFLNQQAEVMASIQRLRADARAVGNLDTTPQQQVYVESGYIRIIPAEPAVIYVPTYDPWLVYYQSAPPFYSYITFGIGFSIGAWLNRDCDWYGQRIYYHGWRGDSWVSRSRRHIRTRNNVYIRDHYRNINVNPRVVRHDVTRYRKQLRRDVQLNPRTPGRSAPLRQGTPPGGTDRLRPAEQTRPGTTTRTAPGRSRSSVTSPGAPTTTPATRDIYRGRDTQRSQPASRSGYGGYGTGRDATIYREHGRSSRENMRQSTTPASPPSLPSPVPVPRTLPTLPSTPSLPSIPARPSPVPAQPSAPAQRSAPVQRSLPSPPSGTGIGQPAPRPASPATGGGVRTR